MSNMWASQSVIIAHTGCTARHAKLMSVIARLAFANAQPMLIAMKAHTRQRLKSNLPAWHR